MTEKTSLKFLVKTTRVIEQGDDFTEEDSFQVIYANSFEEISEAFDEEEEDTIIDYAVIYHPVYHSLIEEFGVPALDGSIRYLLGFEIAPEPELVTYMVLMGASFEEKGVSEDIAEEVEHYMGRFAEGEEPEVAGPMSISDRGRYNIN
jgi:uncharacterized protein YfbU (UPF0304 family)